MNKIDFAIERVFRFFDSAIKPFECFVVQMTIKKHLLSTGYYTFSLKDGSENHIYTVTLYIDTENKKVIEKFSHEDPLITTETDYLVCLQLSREILSLIDHAVTISLKEKNTAVVIMQDKINNIQSIFSNHHSNYSSIIDDYYIVSQKECILRIHVGKPTGQYHEEQFLLVANEKFYFKKYLLQNAYIGLQCSYENERTEIEEKYIVIGQKGMIATHDLWDGQDIYSPLLPFMEKYKRLLSDKFDNIDKTIHSYINYINEDIYHVNSITELLNYLEEKDIILFETNINFIKPQYINKKTYGLHNTYHKSSINIKNLSHINTPLCMDCEKNTECLQIVPSGLSLKLLKENSAIDSPTQCRIYNLIKYKKNEMSENYDL